MKGTLKTKGLTKFMLKPMIIILVFCTLFYVLYINGYMVLNNKKALVYVGSNKRKSARFSSCNGYIKRVVKFKQSKTYHFEFHSEIEKGDVSIELFDRNKSKVLLLTQENCHADIQLYENSRYYLVYRFKSATGKFDLDWN